MALEKNLKSGGSNSISWVFSLTALLFVYLLLYCNRPIEIDLNPKALIKPTPSGRFLTNNDTLVFNYKLTALDGFSYFRIQEASQGILLSVDENQFPDTTILDSSFTVLLDPWTPRDTLYFEFLVRDKKGRVGFSRFSYIMANPIVEISTFFEYPFQSNSNGFFSQSEKAAYSLTDAGNNSDKIDLGFAFDSVWMVAAPADTTFENSFAPELASWPQRRVSSFDTSDLDLGGFNSLRSDGPIFEGLFDSENSSFVDSLQKGLVYEFVTQDLGIGVFVIDSTRISSDSTINQIFCRFKVQE